MERNERPRTAPDAPRLKTRELCKLSDEKLAARAAKYLTLSAEYARRRTFARDMAKPPSNKVPSWTNRRRPDPRVASSWPSFRASQLAAIYAAEGIAGLLSAGAGIDEITVHAPIERAAA